MLYFPIHNVFQDVHRLYKVKVYPFTWFTCKCVYVYIFDYQNLLKSILPRATTVWYSSILWTGSNGAIITSEVVMQLHPSLNWHRSSGDNVKMMAAFWRLVSRVLSSLILDTLISNGNIWLVVGERVQSIDKCLVFH